jgi:O-antigen/teichoic acid export membrane protein
MLKRLDNSAVVWSWVFNGIRLVSGLLLLPLVLRELSTADLGMYYVFLSLVALAPIIDFGFGPTMGRFVSYAMGGAETLHAHGPPTPGKTGTPNYELLWQLLHTTRTLYRYLALAILVIMGIWGTWLVELRIQETSSLLITRLAWAITLASAVFDIYWNWWSNYLLGLNEVRAAARIGALAMAVKFVLAAALLSGGAGLLSVPIATLFSSALQRWLARRRCLARLQGHPPPAEVDVKKYLRILWPNSWRMGVQYVSGYLTINANTAICLAVFGLTANARYGLSVQIMGIAAGMAGVWTTTKFPMIGQCYARHDHAQLRRILWPRVWLQTITFLLLAGAGVLLGPALLKGFGSHKEMLPLAWLLALMLYSFLDMQFTTWGTLIAMGNRLTYLWPTVATNIFSLILSLALVRFTTLGLGALVLGPLLAGTVFNYWYWPMFAARGIETTLFRFLFLGPSQHRPCAPVAAPKH